MNSKLPVTALPLDDFHNFVTVYGFIETREYFIATIGKLTAVFIHDPEKMIKSKQHPAYKWLHQQDGFKQALACYLDKKLIDEQNKYFSIFGITTVKDAGRTFLDIKFTFIVASALLLFSRIDPIPPQELRDEAKKHSDALLRLFAKGVIFPPGAGGTASFKQQLETFSKTVNLKKAYLTPSRKDSTLQIRNLVFILAQCVYAKKRKKIIQDIVDMALATAEVKEAVSEKLIARALTEADAQIDRAETQQCEEALMSLLRGGWAEIVNS